MRRFALVTVIAALLLVALVAALMGGVSSRRAPSITPTLTTTDTTTRQHRRVLRKMDRGKDGPEEDSYYDYEDNPQKGNNRYCDKNGQRLRNGSHTSMSGWNYPCGDLDFSYGIPGDEDTDDADDIPGLSNTTISEGAGVEPVRSPEGANSTEQQHSEQTDNRVLFTLFVALRPQQESLGAVVTNVVNGYLNETNPQFRIVEIHNDDETEAKAVEGDRGQDVKPYQNGSSSDIFELIRLRTVSRLYQEREWWWWQYDILYACFYADSDLVLPVTNYTITNMIEQQMRESFDEGLETGLLYAYMRKTRSIAVGALDLTTNPEDVRTFFDRPPSVFSGPGDNHALLTVYMAFPPMEPCRRLLVTELLSKYIHAMKPELNMVLEGNRQEALPPSAGQNVTGQQPLPDSTGSEAGNGTISSEQHSSGSPGSSPGVSSGNSTGSDFGSYNSSGQHTSSGGQGSGPSGSGAGNGQGSGSGSGAGSGQGSRPPDSGAGNGQGSDPAGDDDGNEKPDRGDELEHFRLLQEGRKTFNMVHEGTHSAYVAKTDKFWWWEYNIVYNCVWNESQEPITNQTLLAKAAADMKQIVAAGVASGSLNEWVRAHYYGDTLGVLNITMDVQDIKGGDDSPISTSSSSSEDEDENGAFTYMVPPDDIAEYTIPVDPKEWDWRRYTGLGIFVGTILVTFVLMQAAACRHRELKKQECWGNLGTERGVEELLGTGWKLKDNQMEIFDKTKLGYDDEQGSMFIGGFEQREAPTEITMTHPESATTPDTNHLSCANGTHKEESEFNSPRKHPQQPIHGESAKARISFKSEMTPETARCSFTQSTESELFPPPEQPQNQLPRQNKAPNTKDSIPMTFEGLVV